MQAHLDRHLRIDPRLACLAQNLDGWLSGSDAQFQLLWSGNGLAEYRSAETLQLLFGLLGQGGLIRPLSGVERRRGHLGAVAPGQRQQ